METDLEVHWIVPQLPMSEEKLQMQTLDAEAETDSM